MKARTRTKRARVIAAAPRFHQRTLGDKLHEIAQRSPSHVMVIELVVDAMITRLNGELKGGA